MTVISLVGMGMGMGMGTPGVVQIPNAQKALHLLTPPPSSSSNNISHHLHLHLHLHLHSRRTQLSAAAMMGSGGHFTRISSSSFKTAVAAVASDHQLSSTDPAASAQLQANNKYYFVVANAKFMLDDEEHFKELLFERLRYYGERSKEQDFWLVIEPNFLDKFPDITKRLGRPAVALVSTNSTWITFMKLRLDRVLAESYEANSLEEALSSNPVNIEFQKPENWVAPYPKYESGWWETFLPPGSAKPKV